MILKQTIESGKAFAESVIACKPDVVACYPITPTTHVTEKLDEAFVNGRLKNFLAVESELSAVSALIGGSAVGARTFSTTASQGLLLMTEALFNASGMRLPIVLLVGNRAVGAPLNIWCDHQDSVSLRDAGWLQFYCETVQEAIDLIPVSFRVAEKTFLPAMVCVEGFFLTHSVETVDVPDEAGVKKFLPHFENPLALDPKNPLTLGAYAGPPHYQEFRQALDKDLRAAEKEFEAAFFEFGKVFGRRYSVVEKHLTEDADVVLVVMGGFSANAKIAAEELRQEGVKAGVLRIGLYRPFPREKVRAALEGKEVGVFERAFSPGSANALHEDVAEAIGRRCASFVSGLGGRDVPVEKFVQGFQAVLKNGEARQWL